MKSCKTCVTSATYEEITLDNGRVVRRCPECKYAWWMITVIADVASVLKDHLAVSRS